MPNVLLLACFHELVHEQCNQRSQGHHYEDVLRQVVLVQFFVCGNLGGNETCMTIQHPGLGTLALPSEQLLDSLVVATTIHGEEETKGEPQPTSVTVRHQFSRRIMMIPVTV